MSTSKNNTWLQDVRFFWAILAIPAIPMALALFNGVGVEELLHPTGEFAARFMIVAMLVSPLMLIFPKARWIRWLGKRRRAIGVAAFFYALLHTVFYVVDMGSLSTVVEELSLLGIWTGWVAMAIFVPLAFTSNNTMVRRLKSKWKTLQRFVYVAAVFTLIHWIFVHNNLGPALVHFVPLAALEAYRLYHWIRHQKTDMELSST